MLENTQILPVNEESIARAAGIIKGGGIVGMPTETVYGLAADAFNPGAVDRIFAAKLRPGDNPLIVHISSLEQLVLLWERQPCGYALKLIDAFWPGPMTLIAKKRPEVPGNVTAGLDTVAVRMPAHPAARALIDASNTPLAAPSANLSGRPSATTAAHVYEDIHGRVPIILDGGPSEVGLESTVIDITGEAPRILRPGGITPDMVFEAAGSCSIDPAVTRPLGEGVRPASPGMKYRHYAPTGALTLFRGEPLPVAREICARYDEAPEVSAIICSPLNAHLYGDRYLLKLGSTGRDEDIAAHLFEQLRVADDDNKECIYSETFSGGGLGLAIMNRLSRAAGFRVEDIV